MEPTNVSKSPTSSTENMEKPKAKSVSQTDSCISVMFDSTSDCGYKSGEINSGNISTSEHITSVSDTHTSKLDQSVMFDSGLISDCCSPATTENITEKLSALGLTHPKVKEDTFVLKDIFTQDKDGDTVLHLAVVETRSDVIFPLIQLAPHPDFLDITNELFQTLLHLATLTGKSNIVRRLVVAGATLDIQDHNGNTPLHIASREGDLDCVQAMLTRITESEIEEAACSYKIYLQNHDLSYLINMKNYDGQSCVHLAAAGGFLKVMECLYNNHADINDQDGKTGRTPLHYAVENANMKLVELLLLRCQADPRVKNYAGHSSAYIAHTLHKRNPRKTRFEILTLMKSISDQFESSSDLESDDSSEEIDFHGLVQNSRNSTMHNEY